MSLQGFLKTTINFDEDPFDKLNNVITSYILFFIGFFLFASEYNGNPMRCWGKPEWVSSWHEYTEDICFIEGTYYVDINDRLPNSYHDLITKYKKVTFYQWVPFLFCLMGILLQLPRFFWFFVNWSTYMYLTEFCETAVKVSHFKTTSKSHFMNILIRHFQDVIDRKWKLKSTQKKMKDVKGIIKRSYCLWNNYITPRSLFISYLIVKIWNIINNVAIFFILTILVADQTNAPFAFSIIKNLIYGVDWRETGLFPRVTMCSFQVREMGESTLTSISRKTVQCTLTANIYIEMAFIIIWCWLIILFIVNIYGFLQWISRSFNRKNDAFLKELILNGVNYVDFEKHNNNENNKNDDEKNPLIPNNADLEELKKIEKENYLNSAKESATKFGEKTRISQFRKHLGPDGILTLYMMYSNAGCYVASQIAAICFYDFIKDPKHNDNTAAKNFYGDFKIEKDILDDDSKKINGINGKGFSLPPYSPLSC